MATLRFPFHHAVQHESGVEDRTVYSGDLLAGYAKQPNYNSIDATSKHYWFDLYYEVPADAYKYTGLGYATPHFQVEQVGRRYNEDYYPNQGTRRYYNEDFENYYDNYSFSILDSPITTYVQPGDILKYPFFLEEYDFNWMQAQSSEYINSLMNWWWGFTSEELVYDSDVWKWYRKISSLYTFKDIENSYLELPVTPAEMILTPTYPVDVYARNDRDLTVAWEVSNNINRKEAYFYIESSTVTITDADNDSITASIIGADSYHIFDTTDLEGLSVGKCTVDIESVDNYGLTSTSSWEFDLTGETSAPEITSVSQNSYPTIEWTSESQIAWELQISNSKGIVYKTGMTPGSENEYTVPVLLEDGEYTLEMRYTNQYGIVSAWGSYFLVLQPTKPDAPEGIVVSARADFGISVSCDDMVTTGKLLVVRRKDSDSVPEVLGEYNGSFVDYLVGLDDPHEYTIRNYVEGYADGEWIDGVLAYPGVVVRDADDYSKYVHVWMSEDRNIRYINEDDRSDVLTQCVGRKFPVSELGEWLSIGRSFTGYVSSGEFKKLQNMKLYSTHVLLQSKEEYFPCYMLISDQGEYNDGRIVNFKMTRIDGDK